LMMIDETTENLFYFKSDDFGLAVSFGMIGRVRSELNMQHVKKRSPEFAHK
jgi:hypothetical protein